MQIIALLSLILGALVIYDLWTNNTKLDETQKLIWTIAAIFVGVVTAFVYYFSFKNKRD